MQKQSTSGYVWMVGGWMWRVDGCSGHNHKPACVNCTNTPANIAEPLSDFRLIRIFNFHPCKVCICDSFLFIHWNIFCNHNLKRTFNSSILKQQRNKTNSWITNIQRVQIPSSIMTVIESLIHCCAVCLVTEMSHYKYQGGEPAAGSRFSVYFK